MRNLDPSRRVSRQQFALNHPYFVCYLDVVFTLTAMLTIGLLWNDPQLRATTNVSNLAEVFGPCFILAAIPSFAIAGVVRLIENWLDRLF